MITKTCLNYLSLLIVTAFCGCHYLSMSARHTALRISNNLTPSQNTSKILYPDSTFTVYGRIEVKGHRTAPIVIAAISSSSDKQEIVDKYFLFGEGYFSLYLPHGKYSLVALSDLDSDSTFSNDECVGFYSDSAYFTVSESKAFSAIIGQLLIHADLQRPFSINSNLSFGYPMSFIGNNSFTTPSGSIRKLSDTLFSKEISQSGIYDVSEFLSKSGLYFYTLDESKPGLTPLVFVHGYGGSPRDFENIVPKIDQKKYNIWFFYYPSGQSLEKTAAIFYEIFLSDRIIKLKPRKLVVIAHSMGGIVARRALNMYSQSNQKISPVKYISLCTPYGGDEQADNGIKNAPVTISSWKEIASRSNFLKELNNYQLNEDISFYLLFGFKGSGSESGDGTIPLKSQLVYPAQKAALSIYGFNETHESILNSEMVFAKINEILKSN